MANLQFLASCLNPSGTDRPHGIKTGEYLLFQRLGPVLGSTVQHRVRHLHGPDTFQPFYVFDKEFGGHIREVLIRNGVGVDHEDGGRAVCFTRHQRWLLNNGGERIRVINRAGTVTLDITVPTNTCDVLPAAASVVLPPVAAAAAAFGELH
jgi:hypothetical protein